MPQTALLIQPSPTSPNLGLLWPSPSHLWAAPSFLLPRPQALETSLAPLFLSSPPLICQKPFSSALKHLISLISRFRLCHLLISPDWEDAPGTGTLNFMRCGVARIWPFLSSLLLPLRSGSPSCLTWMTVAASGVVPFHLPWQSVVCSKRRLSLIPLKHNFKIFWWLVVLWREIKLVSPQHPAPLSYRQHPHSIHSSHVFLRPD